VTKFKNLKDHALDFTLHGEKVHVEPGAVFEVHDDHAFAVQAMGVPVARGVPRVETLEGKLEDAPDAVPGLLPPVEVNDPGVIKRGPGRPPGSKNRA
jgi:hypothetical protein